jgi:hypothetical protein
MEIIRKAAFMIEKERETKIDREREEDKKRERERKTDHHIQKIIGSF